MQSCSSLSQQQRRLGLVVFLTIALVLSLARHTNATPTVFVDGSATQTFLSPQGISPVPEGFGAIPPGSYLIATFGIAPPFDGRESKLWVVPPEGGTPTLFADTLIDVDRRGYRNGLFLPADFGALGGLYAAIGIYGITAFDALGTPTLLANTRGPGTPPGFLHRGLTQAVIAPADFGAVGGALLMPFLFGGGFTDGGVLAVFSDGTASEFVRFPNDDPDGDIFPYGAALAPPFFGAVAGQLLVNDGEAPGRIFAVDWNGDISLFTKVPAVGDQFGPRHMEFSPMDFAPFDELLFVGIARGSDAGPGATPGSLYALNAAGAIVAFLDTATLPEFEPRALHFTGDGRLLIGDNKRVLAARPFDFRLALPVEEVARLAVDMAETPLSQPSKRRLQSVLTNIQRAIVIGDTQFQQGKLREAQLRFRAARNRVHRYLSILATLEKRSQATPETLAPLRATADAIFTQLSHVLTIF